MEKEQGGKIIMCKKCHKHGKCNVACIALMNVPKKNLTAKEWNLVKDYKSYARDTTHYE